MYADTIRRICFMHLRNRSDVEDVFQEIFLKYALHESTFENETHEKAWLIRIAVNSCKDLLKSFWKRRVSSLQDADITGISLSEEHREVLDAVLHLKPPKYRTVIYLHYFEGYKATEIARIMDQNINTVYTWLSRAKEQLRGLLGGESYEGED